MSEKHTATIEVSLPSANLAKTMYRALKPELDARTQISVEDNIIILNLEADTITALRALTNSYLRWMITVRKTMNVTNVYSLTTD